MSKVLTLLVFLCSFISKAENKADLKWESCLSGSNLTTAAMNNCASHAMKDWDAELNHVYRKLMSKLNSQAKEELKLSQRQWLKHRDKEFKFINAMYNDKRFMGTMYSNMQSVHNLYVVKDRVLKLHKYLRLFK